MNSQLVFFFKIIELTYIEKDIPLGEVENVNGIDISIYIDQNPMTVRDESHANFARCDVSISSRLRLVLIVIWHPTYQYIISQK